MVEQQRQLTVPEMMQLELKEFAAKALRYRKEIDTAKTEYKKKYFKKKLAKNNDDAAKLLIMMEQLAQHKNNKKLQHEPTPEVTEKE